MMQLAHVLLIAMILAPLSSVQAMVAVEDNIQVCWLAAAEGAVPDEPATPPEDDEEPECD